MLAAGGQALFGLLVERQAADSQIRSLRQFMPDELHAARLRVTRAYEPAQHLARVLQRMRHQSHGAAERRPDVQITRIARRRGFDASDALRHRSRRWLRTVPHDGPSRFRAVQAGRARSRERTCAARRAGAASGACSDAVRAKIPALRSHPHRSGRILAARAGARYFPNCGRRATPAHLASLFFAFSALDY